MRDRAGAPGRPGLVNPSAEGHSAGMTSTWVRASAWVGGGAAAIALVASGSYAAGKYDAHNADKVDGRDAVGAKAGPAKRAGKLVATDAQGRVPDSRRLGGYTHKQLATMSIPPQAMWLSGSATSSSTGPALAPTGTSHVAVDFVVPPDHKAGTRLQMVVDYVEQSSGSCSWYAYTYGSEGPDGGNDVDNVHNGGWQVPGSSQYSGTVAVPAGAGSAQRAVFTWPFGDKPGMFIQFGLDRQGDNASDNCSYVTITGLQLRY